MERVAVLTGALGFIGSHVLEHWLEQGHRAIVVDALTYAGRLENVQAFVREEERTLWIPLWGSLPRRYRISHRLEHGDLYDRKDVLLLLRSVEETEARNLFPRIPATWQVRPLPIREDLQEVIRDWKASDRRVLFLLSEVENQEIWDVLLAEVDAVLHLAAETHVDRSILDPEPFLFADIHGTFAILNAMRAVNWKGRLLHVSTDEVYGEAADRPFRETDPLLPRNPYSVSKLAADRLVWSYHHTYGLDTVIVRPSNNYGPRQFPEKLIPLMTVRALLGLPLPVYGDGQQMRDWLHVRDCAAGILAALDRGRSGEAYNLGGGNLRPNLDVVKRILALLQRPEDLIRFVEDRPGHDRKYWLDSTRAAEELGWTPQIPFDQGLEETVRWYEAHPEWWSPILEKDPQFRRFFQQWYQNRGAETA